MGPLHAIPTFPCQIFFFYFPLPRSLLEKAAVRGSFRFCPGYMTGFVPPQGQPSRHAHACLLLPVGVWGLWPHGVSLLLHSIHGVLQGSSPGIRGNRWLSRDLAAALEMDCGEQPMLCACISTVTTASWAGGSEQVSVSAWGRTAHCAWEQRKACAEEKAAGRQRGSLGPWP